MPQPAFTGSHGHVAALAFGIIAQQSHTVLEPVGDLGKYNLKTVSRRAGDPGPRHRLVQALRFEAGQVQIKLDLFAKLPVVEGTLLESARELFTGFVVTYLVWHGKEKPPF
jgi:hypothetical protein